MNKTYITISLILAVSLLGYGVINSMTKRAIQERELYQKRLESETQKLKEQEMNSKLNLCLSDAENRQWENWKLNCWDYTIEYFENGEIKNCSVSTNIAKELNEKLQDEKENCIKLYTL